ncbi:MAG TPA: hypothetical protein VLU38_01890, partial [Methanomassiliicoccales archaeon]|nr:hypothetical protein [Methanomassiliicoccales archaeon]
PGQGWNDSQIFFSGTMWKNWSSASEASYYNSRIEEIMRIFGHADTRTTIHYIGLDLDDMSGAMRLYAQYQNQAVFPQMETNDFSQRNGGPIGI